MADIPKVHRVNSEQIKTGTAIEHAEHPSLSKATARTIAMDHIKQNPSSYTGNNKKGGANAGGGGTIVIINEKVHISSTPKKKKEPKPVRQAPAWQTWGSELL
jgi:hypothetical protein